MEGEAALEEERLRKLRLQEEEAKKRVAKDLWQKRVDVQRREVRA